MRQEQRVRSVVGHARSVIHEQVGQIALSEWDKPQVGHKWDKSLSQSGYQQKRVDL